MDVRWAVYSVDCSAETLESHLVDSMVAMRAVAKDDQMVVMRVVSMADC